MVLGILVGLALTSPSNAADAPPLRLHYEPAVGKLGDPMPFYWKGVYHVFYLNYHIAKGAPTPRITWDHISSRDLLHWTEHPMAINRTTTRRSWKPCAANWGWPVKSDARSPT